MVRYEKRIVDTRVAVLGDRPGAGGFLGDRRGVAGPMVGLNVSSAHKARKLQRVRNSKSLEDESAEDREPIVGRVPVKPPVEMRFDRSLLRTARRVGSHYAVVTIGVVSMFDAADEQPWGLSVTVYLPKQSLRYLLHLTARQVAGVLEDARMERWEKAMLVYEQDFKVCKGVARL